MGLQLYKRKRNFKDTPEPEGKVEKKRAELVFVIHRHKASHLHYDLRLELDGTLKSWAVPKGPSMNPKDKRLAMMVEDHPFSYKDFEGIIPEGNYGAGIVEIWDHGTISDINHSDTRTAEKMLKAGLKKGDLKFVLNGKKVKGEFVLVKMKSSEDNAWLLIKHKDKFAVDEDYNSEEHTLKSSPINKWLAERKNIQNTVPGRRRKTSYSRVSEEEKEEDDDDASKKKKSPEPGKSKFNRLPGKSRKLTNFTEPMLAKESAEVFDSDEWIYEIKWDGYRAIAEVQGPSVSLYSRNGNTFNESYPVVVKELEKLGISAVLDGEIIAADETGKASFQSLQNYGTDPTVPLIYYVFDVLEINGTDTTDLPLIERKKLLKELLPKNPLVKYSDHIEKDGAAFFELAKKNNIEGIMAKKSDALYLPGVRTSNWLKIKHHHTREVIITGFTQPEGSRKYFGSLVLGIYENGELKYAGHTGSGFNEKGLESLYQKLKPLIQKKSPFRAVIKTNSPVTWVKPKLVCEIKFTELTREGTMRHPVFLGIREDKNPEEVTIEAQKEIKPKEAMSVKTKKSPKSVAGKEGDDNLTLSIEKVKVNVTHTSKIYWPDDEITKGQMIEYYQSISKYILPYLKGRPQSLMRTPSGIDKPGFYHKDAGDEAPEFVDTIDIFSKSTNKNIDYIICNNAATLAYINNLGCIEINPWHSTTDALDNPDYLVIDLDPSEKNTFEQVIETALVVKEILDKAGAKSICKTSGATGLHIYIPTQKKYTYDQVKDFAELICVLAHEQIPEFTSMERNLKKRGNDKLYLDHLQNRRGQTLACVYSLRPKKGAPVSTPLFWDEVKSGLTPLDFTIFNTLKRLEKTGDIFKDILGKGIDLGKCLKNLGG